MFVCFLSLTWTPHRTPRQPPDQFLLVLARFLYVFWVSHRPPDRFLLILAVFSYVFWVLINQHDIRIAFCRIRDGSRTRLPKQFVCHDGLPKEPWPPRSSQHDMRIAFCIEFVMDPGPGYQNDSYGIRIAQVAVCKKQLSENGNVTIAFCRIRDGSRIR